MVRSVELTLDGLIYQAVHKGGHQVDTSVCGVPALFLGPFCDRGDGGVKLFLEILVREKFQSVRSFWLIL